MVCDLTVQGGNREMKVIEVAIYFGFVYALITTIILLIVVERIAVTHTVKRGVMLQLFKKYIKRRYLQMRRNYLITKQKILSRYL